MNFVKGILETRKQTYRHLQNLLKCLPLETPTVLELSAGNEIRVTLFDANHCVGAVMFLIEGDGKAILYTGDIRSETWFVNSLVRNPVILPYATGIKTLDTIYLDTTFATKAEIYREFPSKASGIQELLNQVQKYPKSTKFYFMSWTFGYEEAWIALSAFLESQIHLDPYRWKLYKSLETRAGEVDAAEASNLCGYTLGNHKKPGCLTKDHNVRIHSCEKGGGCQYIDTHGDEQIIYIMPVVSRLADGTEIREAGVGGGKGDLNTAQEIEIQDVMILNALIAFCASTISTPQSVKRVLDLIQTNRQSDRGRIILQKHLDSLGDADDVKLEALVQELIDMADKEVNAENQSVLKAIESAQAPQTITFPYSRHSSYSELCEFVAAFKPLDVYPCTVDEVNWDSSRSMQSLFGRYCSGSTFRHDEEMFSKHTSHQQPYSFATTETQSTEVMSQFEEEQLPGVTKAANSSSQHTKVPILPEEDTFMSEDMPLALPHQSEHINITSVQQTQTEKHSIEREISPPPKRNKNKTIGQWAYEAALGTNDECKDWAEFGGLASTKVSSTSFDLGQLTSGDEL